MKDSLRPSVHDGLSITGFILAWFIPLIGFILSWVAISTAHRDGRKASGLATAGVILGGLFTLIIVIVIIVAVSSATKDPTQQWIDCLNQQLNNPNIICTPPSN